MSNLGLAKTVLNETTINHHFYSEAWQNLHTKVDLYLGWVLLLAVRIT